MQRVEIDDVLPSCCRGEFAFRMDLKVRIVAFIGEEGRDAGSCAWSIVVREFGER